MKIVHFVQIHLFCGDQLLGSCDVPVDVLSRQLPDSSSLQPLSVSDYYPVSSVFDYVGKQRQSFNVNLMSFCERIISCGRIIIFWLKNENVYIICCIKKEILEN